jgi:VWFA-related protein
VSTRLLLVAGAVVACAGPALGVAQSLTFASRIEVVRVDVLVTERGQVVRGLQPADFDVRDNGVSQQVDMVNFEQLPVNAILAFDTSASVSGERLAHLQGAGHALLDRLIKDDRAALVTFSHVVELRERLTVGIDQVRAGLDAIAPFGDTSLVDGTHAAMTLGASDGGRNVVIVFSDGLDTSSWLSPERVLEAAPRLDVVVYGVSVRGAARPTFLRSLSDVTGGAVLQVESTRNLSGAFLGILDEFRQRYMLSYTPQGVSSDGWHRLDVRIKGRRATVKARTGYQAQATR